MIIFQKLQKMLFILSKKAPSVVEIFKFLYFFPLPFHTVQIEKDKHKWNNGFERKIKVNFV